MLGYVTIGTNDFDRAVAFYETLFAELDAKVAMQNERFKAWTSPAGGPMIGVIKPFDEKKATVGNGMMVGVAAPSRELVDKVYAKALALGGQDEGAPGIRGGEGSTFYGGYFRDLDGNKLVVFNM